MGRSQLAPDVGGIVFAARVGVSSAQTSGSPASPAYSSSSHDVLRDLDAIGDAGDETTRARCRHAIELLGLLEPGWYQTYRSVRPAPEWLPKLPTDKR